MEEESTESKPENLEEDQDDSWEDLTGEFEREEICSIPEDSMTEYSREKSCSAPEESTKEYSVEESCSAPVDSTKENSEEEKENGALQKLPSFEVLTEFPKPDFLKLREDVFTQQQTTFAFRNMTTSGCSLLGLRRRVHKKTNCLSNSRDDREKKTTITVKKKSSKKHKKVKSRDFIASTSGLVLALFATNVLTFVLGCSLGWWSRDAIPTLAVYEFHLDPALL
ncbi:hypothetical protein AVEN_65669-1 [Araneus ventricosus]|uniref:Uncharacterized protein n=1 Tax=Araneus ventricosus TaxID=182803 RepID=A0A4Y2HIZ7_ARAVE|nr:hypothetical protein AVEN_65669-1 [Araneus ventricosus]